MKIWLIFFLLLSSLFAVRASKIQNDLADNELMSDQILNPREEQQNQQLFLHHVLHGIGNAVGHVVNTVGHVVHHTANAVGHVVHHTVHAVGAVTGHALRAVGAVVHHAAAAVGGVIHGVGSISVSILGGICQRSKTVMEIQSRNIHNMIPLLDHGLHRLLNRVSTLIDPVTLNFCIGIHNVASNSALQAYLKLQAQRRQFLIGSKLVTDKYKQFHLLQHKVALTAIGQSHCLFRNIIQRTILAGFNVAKVIANHLRMKAIAISSWINRFVLGMTHRVQISLRCFLSGVKGWLTSATNIAVEWVKAFINSKKIVMFSIKYAFLKFFRKMEAMYSTFAPYIRNMVIGVHRFVKVELVAKWNALFSLVHQLLMKKVNIQHFIVQLQINPSFLGELRNYIMKIATTYKEKLMEMNEYRMKLQALFYFYSRVYMLCMIRQAVIAGGDIHAATFVEMRESLHRFYKLIEITIRPPKKNPGEHKPLVPEIKPKPGPTGGTEISGTISININGRQRTVDIKNAPRFVRETFVVVKQSMTNLIKSAVSGTTDLTIVISHSQKFASNLQVLVTVYNFVRSHQKQLFKIYNDLKKNALAAFDFIEKTLTAQMEKSGGESPLVKDAGETFEATLHLYDILHSAYIGTVEDKENFVKQYTKMFKDNDVTLLKILRSGLQKSGNERKGIALLAPVYSLSVFQKLSFCAWQKCGEQRYITV